MVATIDESKEPSVTATQILYHKCKLMKQKQDILTYDPNTVRSDAPFRRRATISSCFWVVPLLLELEVLLRRLAKEGGLDVRMVMQSSLSLATEVVL